MPGSTPSLSPPTALPRSRAQAPREVHEETETGGGPDRAVGSDPSVLQYCHHPGGTEVLD